MPLAGKHTTTPGLVSKESSRESCVCANVAMVLSSPLCQSRSRPTHHSSILHSTSPTEYWIFSSSIRLCASVYVFSLYNVDASHGVECSQAHGQCLGDSPHGDQQVPQ